MALHTTPDPLLTLSDEQLWQRSVIGDHAAFGLIVERYQALICALALSASGSLARSEDLAQETFITAWRQLGDLREPSKLRAWLCGIVRNLAAAAARREQRRSELAQQVMHAGTSVGEDDTSAGSADDAAALARTVAADVAVANGPADPLQQVISEQEATLLWHTLEQLPTTCREPLVLYYRHGQSVAEVAAALDVSQASIRQRLSRGRALLRAEMTALVERTLARSAPGAAFTVSVLAALPAVAPHKAHAALAGAASGSAAVGGAAVAQVWSALKAALTGVGQWLFIGPLIGLAVGLLSARAAVSTGRSARERALLRRYARNIVIFCWLMSIGLALTLGQVVRLPVSPLTIIGGVFAWVIALVGTILWTSKRMEAQVARVRRATGTDTSGAAGGARWVGTARLCYRSSVSLLGLPLLDVAVSTGGGGTRSQRACGWLAVGDVAVSPLFGFGGLVAAPIALGGVTLGVVSLSLWGAAAGVLAFGSVAAGYWAFGVGAALGWQAAAGGAAAARDYAVGGLVQAAEANTSTAQAWFAEQWFTAAVASWAVASVWVIVLIALLAVGRTLWDGRRQRHLQRTGEGS